MHGKPLRPPLAKKKSALAKYKMTADQYAQLALAHGVACAICKEPETPQKRLVIDHNHQTGAVRGVLCTACNVMLGMARDNVSTLGRAISYLRRPPLNLLDYARLEPTRNQLSEPFRSADEAKQGVHKRRETYTNLNELVSLLRKAKTP